MHKFAERRRRLGFTQKQVADAVGVTSRTVQRWELENRPPELNFRQVWRLCLLLQCTSHDLADDFGMLQPGDEAVLPPQPTGKASATLERVEANKWVVTLRDSSGRVEINIDRARVP